jgi:hypothetical protein
MTSTVHEMMMMITTSLLLIDSFDSFILSHPDFALECTTRLTPDAPDSNLNCLLLI